jgi:hypothetical protein
MAAERCNTAAHKAARRRALAVFRPGTPCPRCGAPMWPWQPLDLGHAVDRWRGGTITDGVRLEHRSCNRSAGGALATPVRLARLALRARRVPPAPGPPVPLTRQW